MVDIAAHHRPRQPFVGLVALRRRCFTYPHSSLRTLLAACLRFEPASSRALCVFSLTYRLTHRRPSASQAAQRLGLWLPSTAACLPLIELHGTPAAVSPPPPRLPASAAQAAPRIGRRVAVIACVPAPRAVRYLGSLLATTRLLLELCSSPASLAICLPALSAVQCHTAGSFPSAICLSVPPRCTVLPPPALCARAACLLLGRHSAARLRLGSNLPSVMRHPCAVRHPHQLRRQRWSRCPHLSASKRSPLSPWISSALFTAPPSPSPLPCAAAAVGPPTPPVNRSSCLIYHLHHPLPACSSSCVVQQSPTRLTHYQPARSSSCAATDLTPSPSVCCSSYAVQQLPTHLHCLPAALRAAQRLSRPLIFSPPACLFALRAAQCSSRLFISSAACLSTCPSSCTVQHTPGISIAICPPAPQAVRRTRLPRHLPACPSSCVARQPSTSLPSSFPNPNIATSTTAAVATTDAILYLHRRHHLPPPLSPHHRRPHAGPPLSRVPAPSPLRTLRLLTLSMSRPCACPLSRAHASLCFSPTASLTAARPPFEPSDAPTPGSRPSPPACRSSSRTIASAAALSPPPAACLLFKLHSASTAASSPPPLACPLLARTASASHSPLSAHLPLKAVQRGGK